MLKLSVADILCESLSAAIKGHLFIPPNPHPRIKSSSNLKLHNVERRSAWDAAKYLIPDLVDLRHNGRAAVQP
jgi:hypothetical protein